MILGKMNIPKVAEGSNAITRIYLAENRDGGKLFYSDDYGANWVSVSNPSNGKTFAMDINDDGLGVFSMNSASEVGQCYSIDYGETLNLIGLYTGKYGGSGAYVSKDGSVMLNNRSNGTSNDLLMSFDGGTTWEVRGTGEYDAMVHRGNIDGSLIFNGNNWRNPGIFKSTDFGNSWSKIFTSGRIYSFVASETCQYMAASELTYKDRVYLTSDYGATWSYYSLPTTPTYLTTLGMDKTGQYISVMADSSDFYISENYGSSFTNKTLPTPLLNYTLEKSNNNMTRLGDLVILTNALNKQVIYSLDMGDNWTSLSLPNSSASWFRAFAINLI